MELTQAPQLLQGVAGSHAYGMNHAASDVDRVGVVVFPTEMFLGLSLPHASTLSYHSTGDDDLTLHEVGKFLSLCLKQNPTAMEWLWLDKYEVLTDEGAEMVSLRRSMMSASGLRSAYLGYINQQLAGAERGKSEAQRQKFGRHLYRLVHQGVELYRTGALEVRVKNPQRAFDIGEQVAAGDLDVLRDLLSWAEAQFGEPSALPAEPNRAGVEDFMVRLRRAHL